VPYSTTSQLLVTEMMKKIWIIGLQALNLLEKIF